MVKKMADGHSLNSAFQGVFRSCLAQVFGCAICGSFMLHDSVFSPNTIPHVPLASVVCKSGCKDPVKLFVDALHSDTPMLSIMSCVGGGD